MTAPRLAVALFVLVLLPAEARAALPAEVADRIAEAAREGQEAARIAAQRAAQTGDPALARMMQDEARSQALNLMDAAVIASVAQHPTQAGEIVAAAGQATPDLAPDLARDAQRAFPYLATAPAPPPAVPVATRPAPVPVRASPAAASGGAVEEIDDPLEDLNRAIFAVNDVFDRFLLRPIAWVYGEVMPAPLKTAVNNGFRNVAAPVRFANDVLQLDVEGASATLLRFTINSTLGAAGLFDVAARMGLPDHPADFGQTLYHYGVGPGPYVVVPLLGPSTVRDGIGTVADIFLHPFTYILDNDTNLELLGGRIVTKRETLIEPLDKLRTGSLDYYAAVRSAYYQDRAVELLKGRAPPPAAQKKLDTEFENAE